MRPGRQAGDAGIAPSFGPKVERIVELSAARISRQTGETIAVTMMPLLEV
jgi:hypothetical protein